MLMDELEIHKQKAEIGMRSNLQLQGLVMAFIASRRLNASVA